MVFADLDEVKQALDAGILSLHSKIWCRIPEVAGNGAAADGEAGTRRVETTPGRMMLYEILPQNPAVSFDRLLNTL